MPLRVFNTKTRNKEVFEPLRPPRVNMYVCGITAYDFCHLGHARAAVVFDVIYRYLRHKGFEVSYIRNFTDIDDKIINRAKESGKDWKEVAETFIAAFSSDMKALGNFPPTSEPRATDFIPAMQEMIAQLIEKGIAYPSGGDVFYSVRKFRSYGELAGKNLEDLEAGARVEVQESKQDPLDYALWKGAKPGEPEWDSPWGKGRPGWHIECSAMSTKIAGPSLDIHGGGRDLIFPHHENERAQSEGALEKPFVKFWLHNGFVNLNADKMSKSTGNFLTIRDVLGKYPFEAIRYFLLSAHYRSPLDFTESNMGEALAAIDRIYQTRFRLKGYDPAQGPAGAPYDPATILGSLASFEKEAPEALDDDFNTAMTLGLCFDLVREINKCLDAGPDAALVAEVRDGAERCFSWVGKLLGIFGREPAEYLQERKRFAMQATAVSEEAVLQKIAERKAARQARDFKKADQIRDELIEKGIVLKDNPDGSTTWTVR